jgi:DnaJ family protein C protein 2
LETGGERVLQLRRLKLEQSIRKWRKEYTPEVVEMDSREDTTYLRSLEPTSWKEQDHYAVLGLKHLRFRSTDEDVKKAYRLRVLRHHPDKRMAAGEVVLPECDYFACIVKAFEILSTQIGRYSYDSVDPLFDNYVPPKTLSSGEDFFVVS